MLTKVFKFLHYVAYIKNRTIDCSVIGCIQQ